MLIDLKKVTGRFLGKFAVKWILKIPPHLARVATHTHLTALFPGLPRWAGTKKR